MALTLLAPQTPMLFMGQEFAASAPSFFRRSHEKLAAQVHDGRREFLSAVPRVRDEATQQLYRIRRANRRSSARSSTGAECARTRERSLPS